MASSTKKNSDSSQDPVGFRRKSLSFLYRLKQSSNAEWTMNSQANSFLSEEKRLLHSDRRPQITNQISQKRLSKLNYSVNQMTSEQLDEELKKRKQSTSGGIEIRRMRLKNQYKSELTFGCKNPSTIIEQHFEYIAVVDFEATCEEHHENDYPHEIIEFPIVLIDVQQKTIVDKFLSYCRPTIKPILSKFCKDLTGIEQHQVDSAPSFVEVFHNVETWLNERNLLSSSNNRRLAFATDGPWDFAKFLRMQCHFSSIPYPQWANKWINIRKEFACFYPVRRCGIEKMLDNLGLSFDGRRHSGLDDAINIARIGLELLKDGCVLLLNDGIDPSDRKFATRNGGKIGLKGTNDNDEDPVVFED